MALSAALTPDGTTVTVSSTDARIRRVRVLFNGLLYGYAETDGHLKVADVVLWLAQHGIPIPDDGTEVGELEFVGLTDSLADGIVATTKLRLSVPAGQRPRAIAGPSSTRRVATALNRPGDKHQWKLRLFDENPAAGSRPLLVYARVLFDTTAMDDEAGVLATVRWTRPSYPLEDVMKREGVEPEPAPKRLRRSNLPPPASWGYIMAMTEVHLGRPVSVFTLPVDSEDLRDGKPFIECEVEWPQYISGRGPRRYVIHVYQQAQPEACLPPAMVPEAIPAPEGKKLAVLVGISKYSRRRSDLEYADDDVVYWYNWLSARGFECVVLGDEFSPYPSPGPCRDVGGGAGT